MVRYRPSSCTTSPRRRLGAACRRAGHRRRAGSSVSSNRRRCVDVGFARPIRDRLPVASTPIAVEHREPSLRPPAPAPSPASWAIWICCGRWRWPAFRVQSSRGGRFLRSIRATHNLTWSGMTIRTTSRFWSTRWSFRQGASRTAGSVLRGRRTGAFGLAASRTPGAGISLRCCRPDAGRGPSRQGALPGPRRAPRPAGAGGRRFNPAVVEPADLGLRLSADRQAADPARSLEQHASDCARLFVRENVEVLRACGRNCAMSA